MNKVKERKDNNTERFMRELAFIEKDIQKLTERKGRLTQFVTQKGVRCFNELKRITPIKQSSWWSDYYYDFQNTQVIDLDYFEVETEHETFSIALEWAGTKQQFVYNTLYELHTPETNQENTEQIAEKMLAYLDEHYRSEHDVHPEQTIYHILHAFKRTYEEKVLTKLEEKRRNKNKTILEELKEFGDSFPGWSPFQ